MGLLSFFQRGQANSAADTDSRAGAKSGAKPVADAADAVQHLRLRARHRLIGAALLVGVGVIGFPLLFETQPRPIPVDLPIVIPSKEALPPLQVPAQLQAPALPQLPPQSADAQGLAEKSAPPDTAPASAVKLEVAKVEAPPKPAEQPPEKSPEKPIEQSPGHSAAQLEQARVQSLLEGKTTEQGPRLIVQVGAFADAKVAQEARTKVEKLGLKTYTQVAETPAGKRVRVRVGPFGSKDEAEKAAARLRAAGMSPAVLTL